MQNGEGGHDDFTVRLADVQAAALRIAPFVHQTPVMTCEALDAMSGRHLFFKCELFQKTGSFKARGACNAVQALPADVEKVVAHSSGNHAQALAWAAKTRGATALIVMPDNAPAVKVAAVRGYGGHITFVEPTNEAREKGADRIVAEHGARLIHPSDNPDVIAGQGTVGLELLQQAQEMAGGAPLDAVIVPVGGGGLLAGIAVAAKALFPGIVVIGAEPAQADDAFRSKAAGTVLGHLLGAPKTVADGLQTTLGRHTWPVVRDLVDVIITVTEEQIRGGMRVIYERMKLAIEPSAGVGVAVALSPEFKAMPGLERVGVILCGGNVDPSRLASLLAE